MDPGNGLGYQPPPHSMGLGIGPGYYPPPHPMGPPPPLVPPPPLAMPQAPPPHFAALAPAGSICYPSAAAFPSPSSGPSVLDRILAADNARKRAADERNALFVAELAASGPARAAAEGAHLAEPAPPQLGAAMLQRASKKQRAHYAGPRAPSAPAPAGVVPTNVYALGIPKDAGQAEVEAFFSKVGPISRAKVYLDEHGAPKGDALVTYRTAGGADAALRLLHGRHVRPGPGASPVSLSLATFEHKDKATAAAPRAPSPPGGPSPPPASHFAPAWPGPPALSQPPPGSAELAQLMARTIVIRHVFTSADVATAASELEFVESIKDDLWEECCRCGELEQISVHVRDAPAAAGAPGDSGEGASGAGELGAVTVRFEGPLPAAEAVDLMDGRYFCSRRLEASFWDGDASFACALDIDRARQLRFGFGDAAARAAAVAAGAAPAEGRNPAAALGGGPTSAEPPCGCSAATQAAAAAVDERGRGDDGPEAPAPPSAAAAADERASQLMAFMAEVSQL